MLCMVCWESGNQVPAAGVCVACGRAVCPDHGVVRRVRERIQSAGGIGGPWVEAPVARPILLCLECAEAG
jgi:hypothetical protein